MAAMRRWMLILLPLLLTACNNVPVVDIQPDRSDSLRENLINANRYIAEGEETQIEAYVARRGWQMQRLTNGARVMVTRQGKGPKIDYEEQVNIRYRLEAINGQVVYDDVQQTVEAGHLEPTRGLDAVILTLNHGTEAYVILPSELGYGVVGDGDRVSTRMILIYDLKIE